MQTLIVILVVAAAAAYLVRGALKQSCSSGCGRCSNGKCPMKQLAARTPNVREG